MPPGKARKNLTKLLSGSTGSLGKHNSSKTDQPGPPTMAEDITAGTSTYKGPTYAQLLQSLGESSLEAQLQPAVSSLPSPASTESLIGRTLMGLPCSPREQDFDSPIQRKNTSPEPSSATPDVQALMQAFSVMLSKGLEQTSAHITSTIRSDIQQLGARIDQVEQKTDQSISRINQNTARIQDLQDQLEVALLKVDDLENRSRRQNFRLRGVPESYKDTHEVITSFIRQLLPDLPAPHLALDRAHRALRPARPDGPPRDIVVKPHYFSTKEAIMKAARSAEDLDFQGHRVQVFTDLSPFTIQRRRNLKPLIQVLLDRNIPYRWAFPLRLTFTFRDKVYGFSSHHEGEKLLIHLGIISQDPQPVPMEVPPSSSVKRSQPQSPLVPLWQKQQSKRPKEARPP